MASAALLGIFSWLIAGLLEGPTATEPGCRIRLADAKSQVRVDRLVDGHTLRVVIAPAPDALGEALASTLPAGTRIVEHQRPQGGKELLLTFPWAIRAHRLGRDPEATTLDVTGRDRVAALRERLRVRLPRSVPSDYLAPRFRDAEDLLRAGKLEQARARYQTLAKEYALHSWAELRQGDVAVLDGRLAEACGAYAGILTSLENRSAATVAAMRLQVLGGAAPDAAALSLPEIWERTEQTDGPVGDYIAGELAWLLSTATTPTEIQAALKLGDRRSAHRANHSAARARSERQSLVARAIRMAPTALAVAPTYYRYRGELALHPERSLLRRSVAAAFVELGFVDEATLLTSAMPHTTLHRRPPEARRVADDPDARLQALRFALGAPTVYSSASAPLVTAAGDAALGAALEALAARIERVRQAIVAGAATREGASR
ncbi:MAG: hypothetical protein HY903_09585 [Deltaproteobacteria bacterium]|nr:hypothetical protein [Deltaproteobacteria bacterium]